MNKKILLGIVVISMIAIWVISDAKTNNASFDSNEDGVDGVAITRWDVSAMGYISGDFVIPSTLNGRPVTKIGAWAFSGCWDLTSVTIPDGVTSIGYCAFNGCSSLTSVTIPSSVTSIGGGAFSGCERLTSIIVDSANQYYSLIDNLLCRKGGKTLVACPGGLTSVTIPSSVTKIGEEAFSGCKRLTSVTIPSSVTSIGAWAFSGCWDLTSVTIPSSVTSIGKEAFRECSSLTSVTFEGVPPRVGDHAFYRMLSSSTGTGYYLPEYAAEWKAVMDTNGRWKGLKMEQRRY